ncbi:hypothetical protein [Azospirillum sp.]|uniref:hypothetical protein n=1 Tax=Azospirillum sp. TaxID=34012 RepID=UPI003D723E5D
MTKTGMRPSAVACVLAGLSCAVPALALAAGPAYQDVAPQIDTIVQNRPKDFSRENDERKDYVFGKLGSSNRDRIAALANTLGATDLLEMRERIEKAKQAIADKEAALRVLEAELAQAPPDATGITGWVSNHLSRTYSDVKAELDRAQQDLMRLQDAANAERQAVVDRLNGIGVVVSVEQLDILLRSITGDDILRMAGFFENVLAIHRGLAEALTAQGEKVDLASKYYATRVVLIDVAVEMHDRFLQRSGGEHVRTLDRIMQEAQAVKAEAKAFIAKEKDQALRDQAENNVRRCDLTAKVASVYKTILQDQARQVSDRRERLSRERELAINTYKVAAVSGELAKLIKQNDQDFSTLMQITLPDMRPFENAEMRDEFERLTKRLASKS